MLPCMCEAQPILARLTAKQHVEVSLLAAGVRIATATVGTHWRHRHLASSRSRLDQDLLDGDASIAFYSLRSFF